jgi:GT2 family glycosyltransferase
MPTVPAGQERVGAADFAVAIVNYNTRDYLQACLASVRAEGPAEVVVVDNASSDGSAAMTRSHFPEVRLVVNGTNGGYGAAANQAIGLCRAPYVLLLNSDTELRPGALLALASYLERWPAVAVAGPRLVNPDGSLQPSCYPAPTPLHVFLEESTAGRMVRFVPWLRERYLRTWSHSRPRPAPWLLGAALVFRRDAFQAVGGFDESFYMYAEEVDLCARLVKAGWQVHFVPQAEVVHAGGASTRQRRVEMAAQYFTSLSHFYRRHYSRPRQVALAVMVKVIVLLRLVRETVRLGLAGPAERAALEVEREAWKRVLWS